MKEFYACRFCGQAMTVPSYITDEEAADIWAASHCSCSEGKAFSKAWARKDSTMEQIQQLFGEESESYGFHEEYGSLRIELLKSVGAAVADGLVDSVKLDFGALGKADISVSAKGIIKVARSHGHKITTEA